MQSGGAGRYGNRCYSLQHEAGMGDGYDDNDSNRHLWFAPAVTFLTQANADTPVPIPVISNINNGSTYPPLQTAKSADRNPANPIKSYNPARYANRLPLSPRHLTAHPAQVTSSA